MATSWRYLIGIGDLLAQQETKDAQKAAETKSKEAPTKAKLDGEAAKQDVRSEAGIRKGEAAAETQAAADSQRANGVEAMQQAADGVKNVKAAALASLKAELTAAQDELAVRTKATQSWVARTNHALSRVSKAVVSHKRLDTALAADSTFMALEEAGAYCNAAMEALAAQLEAFDASDAVELKVAVKLVATKRELLQGAGEVLVMAAAAYAAAVQAGLHPVFTNPDVELQFSTSLAEIAAAVAAFSTHVTALNTAALAQEDAGGDVATKHVRFDIAESEFDGASGAANAIGQSPPSSAAPSAATQAATNTVRAEIERSRLKQQAAAIAAGRFAMSQSQSSTAVQRELSKQAVQLGVALVQAKRDVSASQSALAAVATTAAYTAPPAELVVVNSAAAKVAVAMDRAEQAHAAATAQGASEASAVAATLRAKELTQAVLVFSQTVTAYAATSTPPQAAAAVAALKSTTTTTEQSSSVLAARQTVYASVATPGATRLGLEGGQGQATLTTDVEQSARVVANRFTHTSHSIAAYVLALNGFSGAFPSAAATSEFVTLAAAAATVQVHVTAALMSQSALLSGAGADLDVARNIAAVKMDNLAIAAATLSGAFDAFEALALSAFSSADWSGVAGANDKFETSHAQLARDQAAYSLLRSYRPLATDVEQSARIVSTWFTNCSYAIGAYLSALGAFSAVHQVASSVNEFQALTGAAATVQVRVTAALISQGALVPAAGDALKVAINVAAVKMENLAFDVAALSVAKANFEAIGGAAIATAEWAGVGSAATKFNDSHTGLAREQAAYRLLRGYGT